jgi:hypothetical protein
MAVSRQIVGFGALVLCSSLAHATEVTWQVTGTVEVVQDSAPQLPFPVSVGDSVTLDLTIDPDDTDGTLVGPGDMRYDNVYSATLNVAGHVLSLNSTPTGGLPGTTSVLYNSAVGNNQYENGISVNVQESANHPLVSWYMETVGGLNSTPLKSLAMPQQPPTKAGFTNVGIEVSPLGSSYEYEFLASVSSVTVTPVPLSSSWLALLGGLLLLGATGLRRPPLRWEMATA